MSESEQERFSHVFCIRMCLCLWEQTYAQENVQKGNLEKQKLHGEVRAQLQASLAGHSCPRLGGHRESKEWL